MQFNKTSNFTMTSKGVSGSVSNNTSFRSPTFSTASGTTSDGFSYLPSPIILGDHGGMHPTGYYPSSFHAVVTGMTTSATDPYGGLSLIGFDASLNGKSVKVTCDTPGLPNVPANGTMSVSQLPPPNEPEATRTLYSLTGQILPPPKYGTSLWAFMTVDAMKTLSGKTFNITMEYQSQKITYTIEFRL